MTIRISKRVFYQQQIPIWKNVPFQKLVVETIDVIVIGDKGGT